MLTGDLVPSHLLQKANRFRAVARNNWLDLLRKFDVVVSPTLMYALRKIKLAEPITSSEQAQGQFGQGSGDATITAAFTGTPALTLPCGIDSNGVPIGLQIMAGHFQEERVLRVGHAYERSTDWHTRRPNL